MVEKIQNVRDGVSRLTNYFDFKTVNDWEVVHHSEDGFDYLVVNGKSAPVFAWRSDRYYISLKNQVSQFTDELCSVKTYCYDQKEKGLRNLLIRELDLSMWWLNSTMKTVYAVQNENTMNLIGTMKAGTVCTLELSATLDQCFTDECKHIIYTSKGMVSDRAVDTQIKQSGIYFFNGAKLECFSDADWHLYGLNSDEIAMAYEIYKMLTEKEDPDERVRRLQYLGKVADACLESAKTGKVVQMES